MDCFVKVAVRPCHASRAGQHHRTSDARRNPLLRPEWVKLRDGSDVTMFNLELPHFGLTPWATSFSSLRRAAGPGRKEAVVQLRR